MPNDRYAIDPIAFFLALIGAPLIVALVGFWILLIPVFAIGFGAIPYLTIGAPMLIWGLHRFGPNTTILGSLGALVVVIFLGVLSELRVNNTDLHPQIKILPDLALFCTVFAALWSGVFSILYRWFESDTFGTINKNFRLINRRPQ